MGGQTALDVASGVVPPDPVWSQMDYWTVVRRDSRAAVMQSLLSENEWMVILRDGPLVRGFSGALEAMAWADDWLEGRTIATA